MSNQKYVSPALRKKKQRKKQILIWSFVFLFILLLVGIVYLLNLPKFQINQIEIQGTHLVEQEQIEQKVNTQLSQKILGIIPNSNVFIFSKTHLYNELIQNQAIREVDVYKKLFNTLYVVIEEHQKKTLYCENNTYQKCFFVNEEGLLYATVDTFIIPEQEIIIFIENKTKQIGDYISEQHVFKNLMQFIKSIDQVELRIKSIVLLEDGVIELITREDSKIIMSVFDDFEKNFINLIALFEQEIFSKEKVREIEYIDIRFGNKLFYKNRTN